MKKIISIILAIALLAVPFCSVNVFAEEVSTDDYIGTELIKDGGFDAALTDNWSIAWGDPTIVQATSDYAGGKTGDNCVQIPNYSGGIIQSGINLLGGYQYELSFMIASRDSALGKQLVDVTLGSLVNETYTSVNYNYEKVSYTFTCEEDTTAYLRFDRQKYANSAGVSIDDVSIVATAKTDKNSEIKTGDIFTLYVADIPVLTRTASVTGDCNSDGKVNVIDLVALKKYCALNREFTTAELLATRINGSGEADSSSLCALREMLIN